MANSSRVSPDLDAATRLGHRWLPLSSWSPAQAGALLDQGAEVLTSGGDATLATVPIGAVPDVEIPPDTQTAPGNAPNPAGGTTGLQGATLLARDPLSLAWNSASVRRSPPSGGVDLDASDPSLPITRCACPVCQRGGMDVRPGAPSGTISGGGSLAAPMPAVSLQTLADYLRNGFWQEWGTVARRYNLGSSSFGPNPNNGILYYNINGWNFDTNGDGTLDGDSDGLLPARRDLVREVFKVYEATLGVRFLETTSTDRNLVDFFFADNDLDSAYAYAAGNSYGSGVQYTVVNVASNWYNGLSGLGSYTLQTFLHEIGHGLGLGHQGLYNGTGGYASNAKYANDSWQASMMSYFSQVQNPTTGASYAFLQTPMSADWLALDDIYRSYGYGVANAFRGDTTYGVGTNISATTSRIWNEFSAYAGSTAYTIVDGAGYDTLNVSNFSADQLINLAPSQAGSTTPSISNIGGKIGNLTLAVGTVIEAATGGGGNDIFFGNSAANTFRGGGGNDSFYDSLGSDIYYGDAGIDALYFGESIALLSYSISGDSLLFSRTAGSLDVDQVWSSVDTLVFDGSSYSYADLVTLITAPPLADASITAVNGLASGAATNSTALSISGSLSQALSGGQTIAVYRNGVQVGNGEVNLSDPSRWTFSLQESAGTNSFAYTARVVETASGRLGTLSAPFALTVDTVVPLVSVNPLVTQSTTPLLSGTVSEAGAQVVISIGGVSRSAVNNGNGTWSLQWTTPLVAGATYNVVATASDAAGNSGSDSSVDELSILTTLADASITAVNGLASGAATNSTALSISGSLSQALSGGQTIAVYRNGVQVGNGEVNLSDPSRWTFSLQESAGTNSFAYTARVVETASGRLGTLSAPFALTVDTVAPLVSVNPLVTQSTTPLLSGTVSEAGAQVSIIIGGVSRSAVNNGNGTWSLQWNTPLVAGATYNVIATASDAAGNSGSDSSVDELSILTTLADASITAVNGLASGAATNSTALSISGSLSQALSGGQTIAVYRNGVQVGNGEVNLSDPSRWTFSLQESAGTNSFAYTARVVETASGRLGTLSAPFALTVDTVAPLVSVNPLVTQSTTPLLSGTVSEAGAQVSIIIGGVSRSAVNNGNGTWSLQWSTPLVAGATYNVIATASDAAGNSGSDSTTGELSILVPPPPSPFLHFSLQNAVTTASASVMGGLTARSNDIVAFDGSRFSVWLNGNTSGLSGAVLRDFHIVSPDEAVVAFQSPITLSGIVFDDSDLARVSRSGGVWSVSMVFDGSDVGLTTTSEAIDAVTGLADGSWLISTRGSGGVTGVSSFAAEDILQFRPTSLGSTTAGSWSVYTDMSDVGITGAGENISAVDVGADGRVFLVTTGNVSATAGGTSVAAANEDVVVFRPTQLGGNTAGTFQSTPFFDGSLHGLGANAIQGLDLPG